MSSAEQIDADHRRELFYKLHPEQRPATTVVAPLATTPPKKETLAPMASAEGKVATAPLSGDIDEAISFLRVRPWPPCLSAKATAPDGTEGKFETRSFDNADKARAWLASHLSIANIYHAVNPTRGPLTKKASKIDIARLASLHCDIDPESDETPAECKMRVVAMIEKMSIKPTHEIDSGNGVQLIWDINEADQIVLDGTEAMADDVALYNLELANRYGGDKSAIDVSRVLRAPGTVNRPNKSKLAKGRKLAPTRYLGGSGQSYSLGEFAKAAPKTAKVPATAASTSAAFVFTGDYSPVAMDDPALAGLDAETLALGRDGDTTGTYSAPGKHKRSGAAFAFAIKCIKASVPSKKLAAIFVDPKWKISAPFMEKTGASRAREVERTINNATGSVGSSVFEQMNQRHMAGSVKGKFRVLTWVPDLIYPMQRTAEFQSKDDFINAVVNPKIENPIFGKAGEFLGVEKIPRGGAWLKYDRRNEFNGIDFRPGAPSIIKIDNLDGTVHKIVNMFCGFAVEPDLQDCEAKCSLYLAHVRDNLSGGEQEVYDYILDWEASGVQHPEDPGRAAISLRGSPGDGKGTFALGYGEIYGCHFLHVTHRDQVTGKFNAHSARICLTFADEALFSGNPSDAQILKTLISEKLKVLELKGIDAMQIRSFSRHIFSTNDKHPLRIEHNDRRYASIYVRPNALWADETDEHRKAELRREYFGPLINQLKNGGRAALLGLLLQRDISKFNAERIPNTSERRLQKLLSAPAGDQAVIAFAQDGHLPGALPHRPHIARANGPGALFPSMREGGGRWQGLAQASNVALSDIIKGWRFVRHPLSTGAHWQAPSLAELRAALGRKYPAIEWDAGITAWGQGHEEVDDASIPF